MGLSTPLRSFVAAGFLISVAACSSPQLQPITPSGDSATKATFRSAVHHRKFKHSSLSYGTALRHVVVVEMENRTVDNLFQNFPGADTQGWGNDTSGNKITLTQVPLNTPWDPTHSHLPQGAAGGGFVVEVDNFKNDGWANETFNNCNAPPCAGETALAYVKQSQVQPYYDLATKFTLAAQVFQTNEGPSYPAHQYLIAGQALGYSSGNLDAAELPTQDYQCSTSNTKDIFTVDLTTGWPGKETAGNEIAPCQDYNTIYDLVDIAAGGGYPNINWKSYVPATTVHFWNAPMSIKHLHTLYKQENGDQGTGNFIVDPSLSTFASDVATGNLPPVSYIVPCPMWSDHAGEASGKYGPSFVSFIANTIGQSKQYWKTEPTAVIVIWDDWGGWFDHETPFQNPNPLNNPADPNNYGYRTPMLVISPYSRAGVVDSKQMTQSAILTFMENTFDLGTLGNTDNVFYSGDNILDSAFNFNQTPLIYNKEPLQSGAPNFGSPNLACPDPGFDG